MVGIGRIKRTKRILGVGKPRQFRAGMLEVNPIRGRRQRGTESGLDPLEQRALPKNTFPNATLPERIVYNKLVQLVGEENFIYQRADNGGRTVIGGFVLDFVITNKRPQIALEVLGDYWHRAELRYADWERALEVTSLGYEYAEIWEHEILMGDSYLEQILVDIVGRMKV